MRDSDCLGAIVTDEYFTRPFCLLEMWVAVALEKPIFIVEVERKFTRETAMLTLEQLGKAPDGVLHADGRRLLEQAGVNLAEAAKVFVCGTPGFLPARFAAG